MPEHRAGDAAEPPLPAVERGAGADAERAVVWLHGLGADGHDLAPVVPHLGLDRALKVRFVFPHAPSMPVTLNGGLRMPAWYDIRSGDLRSRHDLDGLRRSAARVDALLEREAARGVPPERTVLAGFSQGGAVALHAGLRRPRPLAGILALSTYLLAPDALAAELGPGAAHTPIFMGHGTRDPMVTVDRGEAARDALRAAGLAPEWHTWPMGHEIVLEELERIGRWLTRVLAG